MKVKVIVEIGFATIEDGSFGQGECEMSLALAQKYHMFVQIIEDKKPVKKSVGKKIRRPRKKV